MPPKPPHFLFVDLFAGAGGTSTGADRSGVAKVIAALNHDNVAISSHAANHPEAEHYAVDVRTFNVTELKQLVAKWKQRYPQALVVLWGSPDCTHFSRAKSGPKNRDTRSLADELPRYAEVIGADIVLVENVEEFLSWGPLGDDGRPLSRYEGSDYMAWVKSFSRLGYGYEYRILNAADYGAHTSRRRYFGMFTRRGVFPAWPEPTHAQKPVREGLFSDPRQPWRPVAEVLNLNDWGRSIFDRSKPLVDRTLRRLIAGLKKYASEPQVMTCNSPGYCASVRRPVGAVTAAGHKMLVTPMLTTYYRTGQAVSVDAPSPTITAVDRLGFANAVHWTDYNYRTHQTPGNVLEPARTITASPKCALVSARPVCYLMNDQFGRVGNSISAPAPVIPATRENLRLVSFLVNPQYRNAGNSIQRPAPVVVASQGSNPLSLAVAVGGSKHWEHQPSDTEVMRELRDTMRALRIGDIYLRMLHEVELARIQGFPEGYVLHGTARHRKKQIGNAVVSHIPAAWLQALAEANPIKHHGIQS